MRKLTLITLLLLVSVFLLKLNAQTPEIDSLETLLQQHTRKDTIRVNLLNETAHNFNSIDIDKTYMYAVEAEKLAKKLNFLKGKAESLLLIGLFYKKKSNYSKALKYYQKSLKINEEIENKKGIANCFNNIGIINKKQGDYPQSISNFQKSLNLNNEIGDKKGVSKCFYNIGMIYQEQGNYPLSLEYFQKSLKINEEIDFKIGIASCFNNIGIIYKNQSNYNQALKYYKKALKINNLIGDRYGISDCLGNLGIIYKKQGNYRKALEAFQKSLKIKKEIEDKQGIANCFIEIGDIKSIQGNYTQEYYQKSLQISEEIGLKYYIPYCLKGLGNNYYYQKKYLLALDYTLKSLKVAKELKMINKQKDIYKQLSEIYEAIGKYKKAHKSYVMYKELNDSIFNENNIKKITGLEYKYKYEKEKQAIKLEQQKKDVIKKEEAKRQKIMRNSFIIGFILMFILVLIVFRNLLQKRKANHILAIQKSRIENANEELHQQNEEIQQLNEELNSTNDQLYAQRKELETTLNSLKSTQSQLVQSEKMASMGVLTAGIAHEINNPLNFIQGGVTILMSYLEENFKEHKNELLPILEMIETGINRTTGIVKSLNQLNRRSEDENKKCNMHQIIKTCLFLLQKQTKDRIKINIHFANTPFTFIGKKGELHQVLLNVLSNAVQAIEEKGSISINTKVEEEKLFIKITDTGYGISKENIKKITDPFFTTKDPGKGTGLGMSIAYQIIKEHKGSIKYESEKGNGTTVIISFPVKK